MVLNVFIQASLIYFVCTMRYHELSWDDFTFAHALLKCVYFRHYNVLCGIDREPRTVIHVKRAKMFDPMG